MPQTNMSASVQPDFPEGAAVVIGGSGGMGREICRRLAECGSDVALTYRNNAAKARDAEALIEQHGRRAFSAGLDIADAAAVKSFFDTVAERFERIHSVIVATGADIKMRYVADVGEEEWLDTINGDLNGFFHVVKAAIPHLRKQGGSLVVTTSAALARHSPKDILSTAPKAGIEALIRGIAREEGRNGIRANTVALGVIDGGLMDRVWDQLAPEMAEAMRRNIPLKRLGLPREIADVAVYLASSRASFVTGQRLVADGGYSV